MESFSIRLDPYTSFRANSYFQVIYFSVEGTIITFSLIFALLDRLFGGQKFRNIIYMSADGNMIDERSRQFCKLLTQLRNEKQKSHCFHSLSRL